jgi:magnesium chelatase family protein
LLGSGRSEASAAVAARVTRARDIQAARYHALGLDGVGTNALCPAALIDEVTLPDAAGKALLHEAGEKLALSARAYHRVLRVARTLADLEGEAQVRRIHLAEAISWRMAGERQARAA